MRSTLPNLSELKIAVIGDVMLDMYWWGEVNRISPEAPVPVVSIKEKDDRPGGAANVALNIKSLGAAPLLLSVIGKDAAGKDLMKLLKRGNISTHGMLTSASRITTTKSRLMSRSQQMLRYDHENDHDLSKEDETRFIAHCISELKKQKPDAVIFEDYNKGVLTKNVIEQLTRYCRTNKIFTAVDPKKKNFFAYPGIDLFKPNLREVKEALHETHLLPEISSLKKIHRQLKAKLHHQYSLITLSELGIFYCDGKQAGIIPTHMRDVADVSGAGDTVIAMATLCMVAGLPLPETASLANLAGGLVCEHVGVVPVTTGMLKAAMNG